MRDTSLCGLGQTAPNPILSTLKYFREEFEEHIFDRKCTAAVCRNLRTFYIDVDKCTGCAACAKKCPTNAIIGTPRSPYFIVEEKCIGCGICEDVCKFSAVFFK
jgi:NAD-dependent dihydropyrimidine dehydrogenase PreA subunit